MGITGRLKFSFCSVLSLASVLEMGLKRTSCWINFIISSFNYDNTKRFGINKIAMEQRRQWNLTNFLPRSTLTHDTEQEASSTTIRLIKNEHRWGVREGILGQEV